MKKIIFTISILFSNMSFSSVCDDGMQFFNQKKYNQASEYLEKCLKNNSLRNKERLYLIESYNKLGNKELMVKHSILLKERTDSKKLKDKLDKIIYKNKIEVDFGQSYGNNDRGTTGNIQYEHQRNYEKSKKIFILEFNKETRNYKSFSADDSRINYGFSEQYTLFNYSLMGGTNVDNDKTFFARQFYKANIGLGPQKTNLGWNIEYEKQDFSGFDIDSSRFFFTYNKSFLVQLGFSSSKNSVSNQNAESLLFKLMLPIAGFNYYLNLEDGKSNDPFMFSQSFSQLSQKLLLNLNSRQSIFINHSLFNSNFRKDNTYISGFSWSY